ncbi:MAG: hypothetical protein ACRELS_03025 [Candidatus Rokuibacteriota bacterium]
MTLAATLTAHAQQAGPPAAKPKGDEPWLKFTITTQEQAVLKQHYVSERPAKQKELPPGLQKKVARGGTLPPGWQKKVARGEVMTDDIHRHSVPLPKEVLIRLPPPPQGTILVKVEGKIVRLLEATKTIIDVFDL